MMLCPSCMRTEKGRYCKTAEDTGDIIINLLPLCESSSNTQGKGPSSNPSVVTQATTAFNALTVNWPTRPETGVEAYGPYNIHRILDHDNNPIEVLIRRRGSTSSTTTSTPAAVVANQGSTVDVVTESSSFTPSVETVPHCRTVEVPIVNVLYDENGYG